MTTPLKLGAIGCGYWGPNLIRNFRNLSDCSLDVVCDVNQKRLDNMKTLYPDIETTTKIDHVVQHDDVDAVVIATPVHFHHAMALQCLQAGKHVLIEKPMASSGAECEELVQTAQRLGLVIMVGHTFLYSPPVRKIKEITDQGDIGAIQYISSRRLNLGLYQKDINVMWDLAPHDVSIINYIMGEPPRAVNCQGRCNVTPDIEDVTNMTMHFSNGGYASIHNSWLDPRKVREMTIVGTRRMIVYDDLEPHQKIKIYDARVEHPPHYDTFAEFVYSYHYGDMYAPHIKQDEPLKVECQHFIDCIVQGSEPLTSGRSGYDLVRILEAASESLRQNGRQILVDAEPSRDKKEQPLESTLP